MGWSSGDLWAKSSPRTSLVTHMEDTYQVACVVWDEFVSASHRQWAADTLGCGSVGEAGEVYAFLAATHDIGKATPVFQGAVPALWVGDAPEVSDDVRMKFGHHSTTGYVVMEDFFKKHGISEGFADAAGSHHGWGQEKTVVRGAPRKAGFTRHATVLLGEDPQWETARQELITMFASKGNPLSTLQGAGEPSRELLMSLTGFTIMCDWLASNPKNFADRTDRYSNLKETLALPGAWDTSPAENWEDSFIERFGFTPNLTQRAMLTKVAAAQEPGLWVVEASVGTGKTETAITAAEILAHQYGVSGVMYCLPTVATTTAFFSRFVSWLGEPERPAVVELKHSRARRVKGEDEFRGVFEDESLSEFFASPKTYPLKPIVVSTIDHLLMASLDAKHQMLRHFALAQKVLIIDEVHSYDAYMGHHLQEVLKLAGSYRLPVLLLSATLSTQTRARLVKAYNGAVSDVSGVALPRLTYAPAGTPQATWWNLEDETKDEQQGLTYQLTGISAGDVVKHTLRYAGQGANVLIIRNTVKAAEQTSQSLTTAGLTHQLLHSREPLAIRAGKEKTLVSGYGSKTKTRTAGGVVVATQVAEQSLDIDFDVLITDLAPTDSIIQRMGRVWRNKTADAAPRTLPEPQVHIISNTLREPWQSLPYHPWVMKQAQQVLGGRTSVTLPHDVPSLIAEAYDQDGNPVEHASYTAAATQRAQKASVRSLRDPNRLWGVGKQAGYTGVVRDIEPQVTVCQLVGRNGFLYAPGWVHPAIAGREVGGLSRWELVLLEDATYSVPARSVPVEGRRVLADYGVVGYQGSWVAQVVPG